MTSLALVIALFSGAAAYSSQVSPIIFPQKPVLRPPAVRRAECPRSTAYLSTPATSVPGGRALTPAPLPPLPAAVSPICLFVFVQMLGEGIAISSLPLHLTKLGASPVQVGTATSCFSLAQMIFCPVLVKLAAVIGTAKILRICITGAALSSFLITSASTTRGVIVGRFFAGLFAASVPVAQSAVSAVVPDKMTARALSRVSAFAQLGVVIGPAASAFLQACFTMVGMSSDLCLRRVFAASGIVALWHALTSGRMTASLELTEIQDARTELSQRSQIDEDDVDRGDSDTAEGLRAKFSQPLLRLVALTVGWSLTLSVSTYCLLGDRFLGFKQAQLSAVISAGAALTVLIQLAIFPRLVEWFGERMTCAGGLVALCSGLTGLSLVRFQPLHFIFYLLNRAGCAISDISTATLVSRTSKDKDDRANNLGLIQSTRALARIVSPVLSGSLFERSCSAARAPGALPYLIAASLALTMAPVPLLLKMREEKEEIIEPDDDEFDDDDDAILENTPPFLGISTRLLLLGEGAAIKKDSFAARRPSSTGGLSVYGTDPE